MPKITKIENQKNKDRKNIYIDDKFSFGVSEILIIDYDLFVGKEISEKDIIRYKEGDNKQKCLEKSYRLLSIRPRSEKELRDKLRERFKEGKINECINKLKDYGYIHDQEFARIWVNDRRKQRGKKALSFELYRKGIEKDTIKEILSNINPEDEFKTALDLVKSKGKFKELSKEKAYKKIGNFLSSRGFSYEIIKKVIQKTYEK